jgi:hypothetical protein
VAILFAAMGILIATEKMNNAKLTMSNVQGQ